MAASRTTVMASTGVITRPTAKRLTVQARKKPGRIDADHPVGTFPAECCIVQRIVFS